VLIVCFDKEKGIFFTDTHSIITQAKLHEIIQIFGANMLGIIVIIGWCAIFTFACLIFFKFCCLHVNKVSEIIGLDIDQQILGQADVKNFVDFIITEYYPQNTSEYLKKKHRLL
jgi:ammonia channel protein AmtB